MNLRSTKIPVNGMHCTSCEGRIERKLEKLEGVLEVKASFAEAEVTVNYDANKACIGMLETAIEDLGYSIGREGKYEKFIGILVIFAAIFLLGNLTDAYDIDSQLKDSVSYFMLFIIGIFTSLHCVGMCGGLMLSQSLHRETTSRLETLLPALSYNIGRILSYTLLGGAVGALGSVLSLTLAMKAGLTVFAGIFMILMGVNMAGLSPFKGFSIRLPWSNYAAKNTNRAPFVVGFFNGLMPCGPLQTMQLYALGTGSALSGATAMFFFALGTAPLMLMFGSITGFLSKGYTRKILRFSGVLVLALGVIMADRGLAMAGMEIPGMSLLRSNTAQGSAAIKAEIQGGVQVIRISANSKGYIPNVLFVQKGIPVKWVIDGEQINSCNNEIIMPALKIEKPLERGENVVEFMPPNDKEISFSCWMGMIRGVFKVVDDLAAVDVSKEKPVPSSSGCGDSSCSRDRQQGSKSSQDTKLAKTPTEQLIKKVQGKGNYQGIELKNNGLETEPILSVAKTSIPIKIYLASDSAENVGKRFEIVQVTTKKSVHSFEVKGNFTETEFTVKEPGLYGIIRNGVLAGAIEVTDNFDDINLEELRKKYF